MTFHGLTHAGKHFLLTTAWAPSQRYTTDSVFWLVQMTLCFMTLFNFTLFLEQNDAGVVDKSIAKYLKAFAQLIYTLLTYIYIESQRLTPPQFLCTGICLCFWDKNQKWQCILACSSSVDPFDSWFQTFINYSYDTEEHLIQEIKCQMNTKWFLSSSIKQTSHCRLRECWNRQVSTQTWFCSPTWARAPAPCRRRGPLLTLIQRRGSPTVTSRYSVILIL